MGNDQLAKTILVDVIALSRKCCSFPIQGKLAYAGHENFIGRVIDGYFADAVDVCLLARHAAHALCTVQSDLSRTGLGLYIFDAYRPLRAVKDFAKWYVAPVSSLFEHQRQMIHYPHLG